MHIIIAAALVSVIGVFGSIAEAATIKKPKAVLELFTSQGCSSCPPADKLLGKFAAGDDVLAISWHVDYWDYLGWKDSFASPENTQRQYRYAQTLNETQVYTPQAIINGRAHVVGSRERLIRETIAGLSAENKGLTVPIDVSIDESRINLQIAENPAAKDATVYILSMRRDTTVEIARGENSGKSYTYYNVMQAMRPVGMITAEGLSMEYPLAELKREGYDCHAIIVQRSDNEGNPSAILGAVFLEDL